MNRKINEAVGIAEEKAKEAATEALKAGIAKLKNVLGFVPVGLPLLPPPLPWAVTVNAWTYEVTGEYEVFKVKDVDNRVIPDEGEHISPVYVRRDASVLDPIHPDPEKPIGRNTRIKFSFSGFAGAIVGPGPKGVGDKSGGVLEKSIREKCEEWEELDKGKVIKEHPECAGKGGNVKIKAVRFDAEGNDWKNLNGEWIKIINVGSEDQDMSGWKLSNMRGNAYEFKDFILKGGHTAFVFTGDGEDEVGIESKLYWGSKRPVWNNEGDVATLKDSSGSIVDQYID
jgi:hypothetical protein